MHQKTINPGAVVALKEALSSIYWYKRDLRTFLSNTLESNIVLSSLNWEDYKRNIVDRLIDRLSREGEEGQIELRKLIYAIIAIEDFSHLARLDDGKEKVKLANNSVLALRKIASGHMQLEEEKKDVERRRLLHHNKLQASKQFKDNLSELRNQYANLVTSENLQQRGFDLEKIIRVLFNLFDLDPKPSFRTKGEQIDGAFSFEGIDYLLEAKWQASLITTSDLDSLSAKVLRKLDNTLGLFISINGYSDDGISAISLQRNVIILMDGSDLMAVLEGRIDLKDLLRRKKRHAAQTGDIYLPFGEM